MLKRLQTFFIQVFLLTSICFFVSCSQPASSNTDNTSTSNTNSDATTVSNVAAELSATISTAVNTADPITLPTEISGYDDVAITWTSDKTAVISNDGIVTLPEETTTVTLTATIKKGSESLTKTISVTVYAKGATLTDSDEAELAKSALTITCIAIGDTLSSVTDNLTLPSTVNGLTVTWGSSNETVITAAGTVTRQDSNTEVTLTATITKNAASVQKTFTLTVLKKDTSGIEYTSATNHGTAETNDNGIKFTLTKLSTDKAWSYAALTELNSGTVYNPSFTEGSTTNSFVYPFVTKGKKYKFILHIEYSQTEKMEEYLSATAGGGLGQFITYTDDWDNSTITCTQSGTKALVKVNTNNKDLSSVFEDTSKMKDISIVTELVTGPKDWGTGTTWITGANIPVSDSEWATEQSGGINLFDSEAGWYISPQKISAALVKTNVYFVDCYCSFYLSDSLASLYECSGNFRTKAIVSDSLTYTVPSGHITAVSDPGGVKITLTKFDSDYEWGAPTLTETTTGTTLRLDSFKDSESFIWPLTNNGKSYTFRLFVEESGNRHITFSETVKGTAGGGRGEYIPSYTDAYNNATVTLTDSGSSRLLKLSVSPSDMLKSIDTSKCSKVVLNTYIASGTEDWGDNTEWVMEWNNTVYPPSEVETPYPAIWNGGLSIFDNAPEWRDAAAINTMLSKNSVYFGACQLWYTLKDYDIPGMFETKTINSPETPYTPVSGL
ncbi:MAG: hypothetical protein M0P01_09735 [Treponema sp.]|nr:hypothetical protein [Treponema sp.]